MPSPSSENLPSPQVLRQLAGPEAFAKGEKLFRLGQVLQLRVGPDRAVGRIDGSQIYQVKLWRSQGELQYSCNCTSGKEAQFCKHEVALGLAWVAQIGDQIASSFNDAFEKKPSSSSKGRKAHNRPVAATEIRAYVNRLDKKRLVHLVLEALNFDEILQRRIMLETIGATQGKQLGEQEIKVYKQLLREAIECPNYIDQDNVPDYVQGIEEAIRPLSSLLENNAGNIVVELCELALIELERASEMVDVSDGLLSSIYEELQRLHLHACKVTNQDKVSLGQRLLNYELEGGLGVFNNVLAIYGEVLGEEGCNAYRQKVYDEWSKLPPIGPSKSQSSQQPIDYRRFQLTSLMERIAQKGGANADILAAIKARDLSSVQDFLSIASLYREEGKNVEALEWATNALLNFPDNELDESGLYSLLINLYQELGKKKEAHVIAWKQFTLSPNREKYLNLKGNSSKDEWPELQLKAIGEWLQTLRRVSSHNQFRAPEGLIDMLIDDGDFEAAWKTSQKWQDDYPISTWLKLAALREIDHPNDALAIYIGQVVKLLQKSDSAFYPLTTNLIRTIHGLFLRLNQYSQFLEYRNLLRKQFRSRRGLMKLLDSLDLLEN